MKKLVSLEARFNTHQKLLLLFLTVVISIIVLPLNYEYYYNVFNSNYSIENTAQLVVHFFAVIFLFAGLFLVGFLICFTFSKKGLLKKKSKLFRVICFNNSVFFKTHIKLNDITDVSILYFEKSQQMALFSIALNPGVSQTFYSKEINILNENHTYRNQILDLKKDENADQAVSFLEENFNLKHNEYNPRFY